MKKYLVCALLGYVMVGSYFVSSAIANKENSAPVMETEINSGNIATITIPEFEFHSDYINMNDIIDFSTKGNQLFLYTSDGDVYEWER